MASWFVQKGSRVQQMSEEHLTSELVQGNLTGLELVRREDEEDWSALHSLPVFRAHVPHQGNSRQVAERRTWLPMMIHLGVFFSCMVGFTVADGAFPDWGAYWAIGLMCHCGVVGSKMWLHRSSMGAKSTAVEQKGAQPAPAAALRKPSPTSVEVHSRLSSALESLLVLAKRSMDQKVAQQVEQLLEETREVEQQQQALSTWTDADTLRSLRQERDALRRQLAASEEPRMLETLEEQRQAVIQRIEVMEEALATMQRLESREKTLLHQVEGIRLLLIKEGLSAEKLSDLGALLKEHSTRSLAREEVEESLARGRMEAKERTRS